MPQSDQTIDFKAQKLAMRFSLWIGVAMFMGKSFAYYITGSAAILSDAAESVVHVIAVSFATYSLWLSMQPVDKTHLYGHDKINYFSAGFEGALIVLAAIYIIYEAIYKWVMGLELHNLDKGTIIVVIAALLNAALGVYLIMKGRKHHSLILVANGKHVLTDCYTSVGVIIGLSLTIWTGWLPWDPIFAIFVALNILWTGGKLIRQSIGGLMDEVDPENALVITQVMNKSTSEFGINYHGLRHRNAGNKVWIEVHLLFNKGTPIEEAHRMATQIEEKVEQSLPMNTEVITHLESIEDHDSVHSKAHFEKL